jgi:hypothetical protein
MLYPSVTEVLSPFADFSMVSPSVLSAASERGSRVHEICAGIAQGLYVADIPEECNGYVESFKRWLDFVVGEVILVETRLVDDAFMYHGQIDLYVREKRGGQILIDLKTPVSHQRTWRIQLAGYKNLVQKNGGNPVKCGSLQLNPKGKPAKMQWYEGGAQDMNYFLQALNLYRYFKS